MCDQKFPRATIAEGRSLGLTLLELLIALGIASALVGMSYYACSQWLTEYYIDTSIQYTQRVLEYIQTIQRIDHMTIMLCHSRNGASCDSSRYVQYLLLVQSPAATAQAATMQKLRFFPYLHPSITLAWQFFANRKPNAESYFYPAPHYQTNGSLVFCYQRQPKKALILNSSGQMRIVPYANWNQESSTLSQHLQVLTQYC